MDPRETLHKLAIEYVRRVNAANLAKRSMLEAQVAHEKAQRTYEEQRDAMARGHNDLVQAARM